MHYNSVPSERVAVEAVVLEDRGSARQRALGIAWKKK